MGVKTMFLGVTFLWIIIKLEYTYAQARWASWHGPMILGEAYSPDRGKGGSFGKEYWYCKVWNGAYISHLAWAYYQCCTGLLMLCWYVIYIFKSMHVNKVNCKIKHCCSPLFFIIHYKHHYYITYLPPMKVER